MSDFSNKCREYLKDTGENVYQLSASSGLDRTSLQRMITGKRLPGIDFVRQFCDSLRINPSQRRELMELYKIENRKRNILQPQIYTRASGCYQLPAGHFPGGFSQASILSLLPWNFFS